MFSILMFEIRTLLTNKYRVLISILFSITTIFVIVLADLRFVYPDEIHHIICYI